MNDTLSTLGITGAGGNVGTTLRKALGDKYRLKLFDIDRIHDAPEPQVQVNFSDKAQVRGVFEGLDALIHLAGNPRPDVPPRETLQHNFVGTSYAFEEARRAGVRKVLFASSNFYHETAITEALRRAGHRIQLDDPPTPNCMYARSKVYGENLGFHLSLHGIQFGAMRIGWTVPGDDPRPYWGRYMRAMFCSHRDLSLAFERGLLLDRDFFAAFVISNNDGKVFDLEETSRLLDFTPRDNAEDYASHGTR